MISILTLFELEFEGQSSSSTSHVTTSHTHIDAKYKTYNNIDAGTEKAGAD